MMSSKNPFTKIFPSSVSTRLQPLIFVVVFAAIGGTYMLASHALSPLTPPYTVQFTTVNAATNNQPISGVIIRVSGCSPTVPVVVSNPYAGFSCDGTPMTVGAISLVGYQVSPNSATKVGSVFAPQALVAGSHFTATITMEPIPPAPQPAPAPAPAPQPAPAPAPGASSSSSSSKSSKSTSSKSSTPANTPAAPSTDTTNPSSSDTSIASNDTSSQTDTSNSSLNVYSGSSSSVTSGDGLVSITFPAGTFDSDAYCSVDPGDSQNVPNNSNDVIGPYSIDCSDANGNILDAPKKDLTVTVKLPSNPSSYNAYTNGDSSWKQLPSTTNKGAFQFKLTSTKLFAVAAAKKGASKSGVILNVIGAIIVILIIGGGFAFFAWRRQMQDTNVGGGY